MKMYLISDNVDTYTGMRLAGVDGIVVHEQDELKQALLHLPDLFSALSLLCPLYSSFVGMNISAL